MLSLRLPATHAFCGNISTCRRTFLLGHHWVREEGGVLSLFCFMGLVVGGVTQSGRVLGSIAFLPMQSYMWKKQERAPNGTRA